MASVFFLSVFGPGFFKSNLPATFVVVLSVVVGLLMVVVFRYTSDQAAIKIAKDRLKAHVLAVRLYQDQLSVVLHSYGRILLETGRYLRLSFRPVLFVIVPLTIVIVQVDRYLGSTPLPSGKDFLITAHVASAEALDAVSLQVPPQLTITAPAVHAPSSGEVIWRVSPQREGNYDITVRVGEQSISKSVVVGSGMAKLSPLRTAGHWDRWLSSAEPALPANSSVRTIEVAYPVRDVPLAGFEWNWIWLFFVLSLVAGFFFKTVLGIEI